MLLFCSDRPAASYLTVHVTDFMHLREISAWRRKARVELPRDPGFRFGKSLTSLAGRRTYGFGPGMADPRRQVTLIAWTELESALAFADAPLGRDLTYNAPHGWQLLASVRSTRGSFYGDRPLAPSPAAAGEVIAVLTLGRTRPLQLPRFLAHGARLTEEILAAAGLITAVSAGLPLTGNATFSIWKSQSAMLAFARGRPASRHHRTATATPPILAEQLNARLCPLQIDGRWDPESTLNSQALDLLSDGLGAPADIQT